ncbi:MAG TPA: hypothetical protein VG273_27175 [Bryobacteraceae bacterium]|jgi:uncharacterized protein with FMN-binding domain|nr:hypothetical protein [Bryobacteraceae bacterium]
MKKRGSNKKIANGLVAVSSAAVMAVYAAGYTRTRSAADQLEGQSAERRPPMPRPGPARISPVAEIRPAPAAPATPLPVSDLATGKEEPKLMAKVIPPAAKKAEAAESAAAPAATTPAPAVAATSSKQPAAVPAASTAVTPAPVAAAAPAATQQSTQQSAQTAAQAAYKAIIDAALPPWKDGTYEGWGTCRHGDLAVKVVVEAGKISSAFVSQCLTRYSCDIIDKLPPQVVQKQSPEVTYVSGATQSTDAYYWAVVVALGKAK